MIHVDVRGLDAIQKNLARLQSDLREKALAATLNKVGPKARTEMTRAITAEFNLKATDVRPRLSLSKASRDHLVVVLDPYASKRRGRSLNLIHFVESRVTVAELRRRRKTGDLQIGFKIKRGGGTRRIPGAFIANQGRTVFKRVGRARLPIQAVSTIDVPQMFNARRIAGRVLDRIRRELPVEVERAVNRLLR